MPAFALHIDSCKELFEQFKLRKQSTSFALFVVGSVLTDLEEFGILKNVHGRAEKFLQYLLKTDPKYAPLAVGMIMHEELDAVVDKHHVHPNIPTAKKLLEKHNMHSGKVDLAAHYLIDHCVTCNFVEQHPDVIRLAETAKKKLKHRHIHKIAYHLTNFFGGEKNKVIDVLHTFRDFDLHQYLSEEKSANVYGKFLFLQQELKEQPIKISQKIKLGLQYGKFLFKHKKQDVKQLCKTARVRFDNHKESYQIAKKSLVKRFAKLNTTYIISFKH
ncbi:hypothetical protein COV18_06880 [Candidatus Woesearchaeota archaeon CG10_big_fil_rev_8_21_14_0_10_37_12]|nr:MAG: hypothetical protein COV18_06880 [Candidatus Woesearchaeota archaeon CG10_big_fil_rev_8_21_14_0_10_37_12]